MKFSLIAVALTASIGSVLASPPTADQLKIDITKEVKCSRKTQPGDKVSVHYKGTLEDGTKFDSSYDRGSPLGFSLGSGQVIKCWDEGLLDMCIGEKRTLWCDSSICYGERGIGPIPGGANLIFETELVGIAGVKEESEEVEDLENDEEISKDEL
ncbi:FPR2 [Candida jiufengensis]|uniref:FPR2 n=1 Tax=Candida jiufengensis TaxID=497108 RepID=UPI0022254CFA|nr:FPR2 [Candida jiufengensis]KAI5954323.1 FPR2 [Candida jiufengensis]